MTEQEKMESGLLYDASAPELLVKLQTTRNKLFELNYRLRPSQTREREQLLREILGTAPRHFNIVSPFLCDYGHNIHVGENFFAIYNCVMLDEAPITIGDNVFFGPRVGLYTPYHPIDAEVRNEAMEGGLPITIGGDVWFGGNVIVCPGVTIGDDVVIGAGSVVTKDIPSHSVAVGNPCRVIREIGERDREYWQSKAAEYRAWKAAQA